MVDKCKRKKSEYMLNAQIPNNSYKHLIFLIFQQLGDETKGHRFCLTMTPWLTEIDTYLDAKTII